MAEIVWLPRALSDLARIETYIAQVDRVAANQLSNRLRAAANSLSHFPQRGRPAIRDMRTLTTIWPYLIFYVVRKNSVYIVRIRHGRRKPLAGMR